VGVFGASERVEGSIRGLAADGGLERDSSPASSRSVIPCRCIFSSHAATFTTIPASPTASVFVNRQVGLVVDGATAIGYSGILGTTESASVSGTVSVDAEDFFSIVADASGRRCFSGPTGHWSTVIPGSYFVMSGVRIKRCVCSSMP
jgi:hypothetical protein